MAWHVHGVVLPGDEPTDLWVDDGRVTTTPIRGAETLNGFIVPGLVDQHSHIGLAAGGAVDRETAEEQARCDRDSGVLLIRDAGSPIDTHWIDDKPELPRIIRAGRHIARPKRYIRNFAVEIEPDELVDEVERQAKAGDGWVKLVGDWIDREIGDLAPLWDKEIARQAINRAHELGARVTAHCFAEQSVAELVDVGIDCIEHGTGMSAEVIDAMAARQVGLVPTMTNLELFPYYAKPATEKYPVYAAHMRKLYEARFDTIGAAREAGVPIYAGTDSGGTLGHGRIAEEVALMAKISDPSYALGGASWRARDWLGVECLEDGASADLVIYDSDPRADLAALENPALVMLRGRSY